MRLRATLALLVTGCGSATLSPSLPDVAAPDAAAPDVASASTPDSTPVTPDVVPTRADLPSVRDADTPGFCGRLTFASPESVTAAAMTRVPDGLVVAWAPRSGGQVVAQTFDERFAPLGPPLSMSLLTNGAESVTVSFVGNAGVIAAGSSLYAVSTAAGRLTLAYRNDFPRRIVRAAYALSATSFRGVTADGGFIFTSGERSNINEPNVPLTPPHGPRVTLLGVRDGGGYAALDPQDASGSGLVLRRFIFGHGASIEVTRDAAGGASASRAVLQGDLVYRLTHGAGREIDVALEARDAQTFALRREPAVVHQGAGWISATGALGVGGSELFMA